MNKKIIAIALAFVLPLTAAAFPGSGEGRHHGKRMERLTKELNLTDEQRTQLETVFKEQHEKYKTIHEETRGRMKEVLTEEQMTKLDEMNQRRHEKWQEKRQERRQDKTGAKAVEAQ